MASPSCTMYASGACFIYRIVIAAVACPNSFCNRTMGTPACAACTAKVCRASCGVACSIPAALHVRSHTRRSLPSLKNDSRASLPTAKSPERRCDARGLAKHGCFRAYTLPTLRASNSFRIPSAEGAPVDGRITTTRFVFRPQSSNVNRTPTPVPQLACSSLGAQRPCKVTSAVRVTGSNHSPEKPNK